MLLAVTKTTAAHRPFCVAAASHPYHQEAASRYKYLSLTSHFIHEFKSI